MHFIKAGLSSSRGWKKSDDFGVVVTQWRKVSGLANAATSSGTEKKEHALFANLAPTEGTPR